MKSLRKELGVQDVEFLNLGQMGGIDCYLIALRCVALILDDIDFAKDFGLNYTKY